MNGRRSLHWLEAPTRGDVGSGLPRVEIDVTSDCSTPQPRLSDSRIGYALIIGSPPREEPMDHTVAPANRLFLTIAWIPQLPSTTWVTPKSTATELSEIASSSLNPLVVIRNVRTLRKASLRARSIED